MKPSLGRRHFLRGLSLFITSFWGVAHAQARNEKKPLILGVLPNLSPRSLLAVYQPLRAHLQAFLHRPTELFTAPDFQAFYQRTVRGEYDLALMPAHLARLAQIEAQFIPLAKFMPQQYGVVVVGQDSALNTPADLAGKRVALVDQLALVTLRGEDWLDAHGVSSARVVGNAVHFVYHNSAVEAVINGHADAAIVSSGPFYTMARESREKVRVLANIGEMPANVFMAHPRLPASDVDALREVLLEYARRPGTLKGFMDKYRYDNIAPIEHEELQALDRYAKRAQQIMTRAAGMAAGNAPVNTVPMNTQNAR